MEMQEWREGTRRGLANQFVILCMSPDPEPDDAVRCFNSNRSILEPGTRRPKPPHLLEMQRRVLGISFQQFKCSVGLFADRSRKGVVAGPKLW